MAGTRKRTSDSSPSTRASKTAKTENGETTHKGKRGPKAAPAFSAFKAKALPLHINITHTPPVASDDAATVSSTDPGFIGTTALVATSFATGSYGWKGNKRFAVELENPEGGEKEKVQVMLTINATVIGSKKAKDGDEEDGHDDKDDAEEADEHVDEKAEEAVAAEASGDVVPPAEGDAMEATEEKPTDS